MGEISGRTMEELLASGEVKGVEALEWLDANNEYVYHGSSHNLSTLEPRQPYTLDKETKRLIPDGDPAVCATRDYRISVFRSLISNHIDKEAGHKSHRSSFGHDEGGVWMKASQRSINRAMGEGVVGFVHVFKLCDFTQYRGLEWRSSDEVRPEYVVEVSGSDLWEDIEVVEN